MQAFLLVPIRLDTHHAAGMIKEHFIFRVSRDRTRGFPVAKVTLAYRPGALVLGTGFQSRFVLPCHLLG